MTNVVMDNLDEVIIIKNEKGIQYVNKKGFEIIDSIQYTNLEKQIEDAN
jgi:hypothetical protein